MQEKRNSIANAMALHISSVNPSISCPSINLGVVVIQDIRKAFKINYCEISFAYNLHSYQIVWNFTLATALLPCFIQIFKTIWWMKWVLQAKDS